MHKNTTKSTRHKTLCLVGDVAGAVVGDRGGLAVVGGRVGLAVVGDRVGLAVCGTVVTSSKLPSSSGFPGLSCRLQGRAWSKVSSEAA